MKFASMTFCVPNVPQREFDEEIRCWMWKLFHKISINKIKLFSNNELWEILSLLCHYSICWTKGKFNINSEDDHIVVERRERLSTHWSEIRDSLIILSLEWQWYEYFYEQCICHETYNNGSNWQKFRQL